MQSEEERRAQERTQQRAAMFSGAARLVLVAALGIALALWPYERECGSGLFGFLGVELMIVIGGIWVAFTTWRYRLPRMHVVSLFIILGGLTLLAAEVLPRIGYASVDPKHPPSFSCADVENGQPQPTAMGLPVPDVAAAHVHGVASSLETRWHSKTEELAKQFQPQKAALVQLERAELLAR
ncbi:MAG TPA: hypothetical protein VJ825_07615 [Gemmatimonadaceae bacterium]|nr:hypothetical protein [Gemmatimonadaceae bacterium]